MTDVGCPYVCGTNRHQRLQLQFCWYTQASPPFTPCTSDLVWVYPQGLLAGISGRHERQHLFFKCAKGSSKKSVTTLKRNFVTGGNCSQNILCLLEHCGAPLSKRCRYSSHSEVTRAGNLQLKPLLLSWQLHPYCPVRVVGVMADFSHSTSASPEIYQKCSMLCDTTSSISLRKFEDLPQILLQPANREAGCFPFLSGFSSFSSFLVFEQGRSS